MIGSVQLSTFRMFGVLLEDWVVERPGEFDPGISSYMLTTLWAGNGDTDSVV